MTHPCYGHYDSSSKSFRPSSIYRIHTFLAGYIELGRGECHHVNPGGTWSKPPVLFGQASKAELRQMCDLFKGCIAFEFNNDTKSYNSLRFRSVSALEAAASKSSGWDKWEGECQSHCQVKATAVAKDADANRGCWVKDAIPGWYISFVYFIFACVRSRASI